MELARKFLANILVGYAAVTVLTVSIAIGLLVGGLAKSKGRHHWTTATLYGLMSTAASVIVIGYAVDHASALVSPEQKIRSFLSVPGYTVETRDPPPNDTFLIRLKVSHIDLLIFAKKKNSNIIGIQGVVTLTDAAQRKFTNLTQTERLKFEAALALHLIGLKNVEYDMELPKRVEFRVYVPYSGTMSQHEFLKYVFDAQNAAKTIVATISYDLMGHP